MAAKYIGAGRYDLIMNTKGFDAGVQRMKSGTDAMARSWRSISKETASSNARLKHLRSEMDRLHKSFTAGQLSSKSYAAEGQRLQNRIQRLTEAQQKRIQTIRAENDAIREGTRLTKAHGVAMQQAASRRGAAFRGHGGGVGMAGMAGRGGMATGMFGMPMMGLGGGLVGGGRAMAGAAGRGLGRFGRGAYGMGRGAISGLAGFAARSPFLAGFASIYGAQRFAGSAIRQAGRREQSLAALEVLAGPQQSARLYEQLRDFDLKTTLNMQDVMQASTMLMNVPGMTTQRLPDFLKRLGDVSMGDSERFVGLARAFSQTGALGKLTAEEQNQMSERLYNPMPELQKVLGASSFAEVIEMRGRGEITFEHLAQALEMATDAGGRFEGGVERMADTLDGKISIMRGSIDKAFGDIGTAVAPAVKAGAGVVGSLAEHLSYNLTPATPGGTSNIGGAMGSLLPAGVSGLGSKLGIGDKIKSYFAPPGVQMRATSFDKGVEGERGADWGKNDMLFGTRGALGMASKAIGGRVRGGKTALGALSGMLGEGNVFREGLGFQFNRWMQGGTNADDFRAEQDEARRKQAERQGSMSEAILYAQEQAKAEQRAVAAGPNAIGVGSAEAAEWFANQTNTAMAAQMQKQEDKNQEQVIKRAMEEYEKGQTRTQRHKELVDALQSRIEAAR